MRIHIYDRIHWFWVYLFILRTVRLVNNHSKIHFKAHIEANTELEENEWAYQNNKLKNKIIGKIETLKK